MKLKRYFDVFVSIVLLIIFSPILLIIAGAILYTMGRPVLFTQERVGYNERVFLMRKFRTMGNQRDVHGRLLPDVQRITALGRFLRATSLDELPELFHVLSGDMSLVGPRPLLPQYIPRYTAFQRRRHEVLPGISGWAQVNGRQNLKFSKRIELDVCYVDNQSFGLDLKILLLTVLRVVQRDGVKVTQSVEEVDDLRVLGS